MHSYMYLLGLIPTSRKISIILYNGNWDAVVPYVDTLKNIKKLDLIEVYFQYFYLYSAILGILKGNIRDSNKFSQEFYLLHSKELHIRYLKQKEHRLLICLTLQLKDIKMVRSFRQESSENKGNDNVYDYFDKGLTGY